MSGHPRRGRPGPFHRRLLPIVAVLCVVMTTGACNPLDVLHYLAGCKDGSSSSSSASSSTVASTAKGEWTKLIGKTEGEIKRMWTDYVTPCSGYNIVYGGSGLQCTWWACMRQRALGHDLGQGSWGDGGMWGASAKAHGWKQGAKAGGIVSWTPGAAVSYIGSGGSWTADGRYGHVAVVEQVDGDSVHISEGGSGFKNANGVVSIHSGVISAKSPGATFWYPDGNTTAASKPSDGTSSSSQGSSATSTKWTCSASSSDDSDTGTVNVKYSGNGYHASPEDAKGIAKQMIASGYKEWDNDNDWQALVWIWQHESGWQWNATNPTSGAYGIPQSYPASKLAAAGSDWKDNAATQIKWGLQYIKQRYGSPHQAKEFWLRNNAY